MTNAEDSAKRTGDHNPTNLTMHPVVRQLEHPERKLTLLFIASSGLFGIFGTFLGTFMLAALSGVPISFSLTLFSAHPFLQIYGFIAEFVAGVSYSLLPRFKASRIPSLELGYATYFLLTSGNILFLLSVSLSAYSAVFNSVAPLLILAGAATYAAQVILLASHPSGGFPETNSLIALSSLSLVLISLALLLEEIGLVTTDEFSAQMIFLALLGFAGSMIYSVEIRSVSFRQSDYRKRLARITSVFQTFAIGITFLSIFPIFSFLSVVGAVLFLAGGLSLILTVKIFEFSRPMMYRPAMTKMHFSILRYNEVGIISGSIWLLFGIILGIVLIGTDTTSLFIRDSFIHSIAIGFIGSTIIVFAPMLLPGLIGKRAPTSGLSYGPILLLDAAILLRVIGDSFSFATSTGLPIWESFSGPLILGSIIWLLIVVHRVGRNSQVSGLVTLSKPANRAKSDVGIKNVRDATITVAETKTGKELSLSVWFAEENGVIYLLPIHGHKTKWFRNAVSNHRLQIQIDKRQFTGEIKEITEKKEVERAIGLFKDKYGERVYKNFYGELIDLAVMMKVG